MSGVIPARAGRGRRVLGWGMIALAFVVVGAIGSMLADAGRWTEADPLDPVSAGPDGARAIAEVLREQGVDVVVERTRDDALTALADADGAATLVLPDVTALTDSEVEDLASRARSTVLVEPYARVLRLLLPGSAPAGITGLKPIAPGCDLPSALGAGDIVVDATYSAGDGVTGCYPEQGAYALLSAGFGDGDVTAVDGRSLLANDSVHREGNAALALAVLGRHPQIVWYVPSAASATGGAPTLGELTPPWVTPVMTLLIFATLAAGVWRGRRFGPLVAENLPVTVRASETGEGRARLYAHAGDAPHAWAQVRGGARVRMARRLGLGPRAQAEHLADVVAAHLGVDRAEVHRILVDASPGDDHELVALTDRLRDLETRVRGLSRTTTRPEGITR